jgi:hypothetical protein
MRRARHSTALLIGLVAVVAGCGERGQKYDTNLLTNGSFEKLGSDGTPKGWRLVPFGGSEDQSTVVCGVDTMAVDGDQSWFFRGDPGTRRWYLLEQEVEVGEIRQVHIRGWMQTEDVQIKAEQLPYSNFLLRFYDVNHRRLQELRIFDKRTPLHTGTNPWREESYTYRVPSGIRYVAVSCVLGMSGQTWFDNVSLSVPKPVEWETAATKNFVFHWLPGHPLPEGSQEAQQQIFDYAAGRLGLESDVVINYYFYPDSATIQRMLSVTGSQYIIWDENEFHSINPRDDHEFIHFMTDPIGRPPRALAEGTVFWIQNQWAGRPLDEQLKVLVQAGAIPPMELLFDYNRLVAADARVTMPVSAAFVKFIVERWGTEKLMKLYAALTPMDSHETVAAAFERVYKVPMADAEVAWRAWLRVHYGKG